MPPRWGLPPEGSRPNRDRRVMWLSRRRNFERYFRPPPSPPAMGLRWPVVTDLLIEALMQPGDLLEPLVVALRQRPAWMVHAACRGLPTEAFFPPPGYRGRHERSRGRDALAVCEGCPVQEPCASYAREEGLEGIFGASTTSERRSRAAA